MNDMKYNKNYEDKKSIRDYFIENLINQYYQQSQCDNNQLTSGFVFLPSDPDEFLDQLKLLYFEKEGGNDNPQLNEQVIQIADKLLEYECITTNQHQNVQSNFKKAPLVD